MTFKMNRDGKLIFNLAVLFLLMGTALAQDPYLQNGSQAADEQANQLMRTYQQELGMTVEQALLFRNKAEEFVIRRQEIKSRELPHQEKLGLLQLLSEQETAEMANILTRPQLRAYRNLKLSIQPVQVVVEE